MPPEVIAYAREFSGRVAAEGVVGCGKHFPGLGGSGRRYAFRDAGDRAHLGADVGRGCGSLSRTAPSDADDHDESCGVSAHARKNEPASASRFWITQKLAKRIGYKGMILSDDLEMGGILKFLPVEEAAVAAIRAGSDLLEICHSPS